MLRCTTMCNYCCCASSSEILVSDVIRRGFLFRFSCFNGMQKQFLCSKRFPRLIALNLSLLFESVFDHWSGSEIVRRSFGSAVWLRAENDSIVKHRKHKHKKVKTGWKQTNRQTCQQSDFKNLQSTFLKTALKAPEWLTVFRVRAGLATILKNQYY